MKALALEIVVTTVIYVASRFWAKRAFRALGETTANAGVVRIAAMVILTTIMDAIVVLID